MNIFCFSFLGFFFNKCKIKQVQKFKYLESVLKEDIKCDTEIKMHWDSQRCLPKAEQSNKKQKKLH